MTAIMGTMAENRAYLVQNEIPQLVNDLVQSLVTEKPADHVAFMTEWMNQKAVPVDSAGPLPKEKAADAPLTKLAQARDQKESTSELPRVMTPETVAEVVDSRDLETPDHWIARDPRLLRLSGAHPLICEPPLDLLFDQGFLTPPAIHYVYNHGAVPKINWGTHTLVVDGLVNTKSEFTMDDLAIEFMEMHTTLPATLVSEGNRGKEQNLTKPTTGLDWGAGAIGTAQWSGIRLSDLLLHIGYSAKARYVCFEGVEDLPNGKYGTCIPIGLATSLVSDVLLAWEMNGTKLTPDHGYPLRLIVPGWHAGRMVRWLKRITLTEEPSTNHYHNQQRILPPHVDAKMAQAEGWYDKPEYLFNELNINSAVAYPAHNQFLEVEKSQTLTIKGYAYSGGGRKVTRVEISFDGCQTWELCTSQWPEEQLSEAPKRSMKYWCWMFYEYTVDWLRVLQTKEFAIRAWDESSNTQPVNPSWTLTGMGNNPVYRVKMQPRRVDGAAGITFIHPTAAGPARGGWMDQGAN